ncbi:hypothetical protein FACS1894137_10930 [Spirochaetia bacterium]|nr:hypothetical protein FACS1894137_10930 [Spirochaetia bacterium]
MGRKLIGGKGIGRIHTANDSRSPPPLARGRIEAAYKAHYYTHIRICLPANSKSELANSTPELVKPFIVP